MNTEAPQATQARKPDRTLVIILSVIGVLIIVALVAVFSRGEPELLDASTPEGVVQRYSTAVIDGDETAAAAYLTPEARDQCEKFEGAPTDNLRVTLVDTTERTESADVDVSIVTTYDQGPFGSSEYEEQATFDLLKIDDEWLIDTTPWQLTICTNTGVK